MPVPHVPGEFHFDPERDAILPVDDCWLVASRLLAQRVAPSSTARFEETYPLAVDRLAERGFGCVPDPRAGDPVPEALVASCIVYRLPNGPHRRRRTPTRELHVRLVCQMARTDGTFVGSELAVALDVAERLAAGDEAVRRRLAAIVRELFINARVGDDPMAELAAMPPIDAAQLVEALRATAWADGILRAPEERMLLRVHELLGLPAGLVAAGAQRRAA